MLSSRNARADPSTVHPPFSAQDHHHASRSLKDHSAGRENVRNSPQKSVNIYEDSGKRPSMHKKNKSSVSLKSLIGSDKVKPPKPFAEQVDDAVVLKRPKSSTGLSALLSRSKTPKGPKLDCKSPIKDKENRTPPQTADVVPPPAWAQFATRQQQDAGMTTAVPLNDRVNLEREATLYTPQEYSPSKQRNFHDYRPTLDRKVDKKLRPRSEIIGSTNTNAYISKDLSIVQQGAAPTPASRESPVKEKHPIVHVQDANDGTVKGKGQQNPDKLSTGVANHESSTTLNKAKRGSRVMAAVAALNGNSTDTHNVQTTDSSVQILDVKAIESEFETLLVRCHHNTFSLQSSPNARRQGTYRTTSVIG